MPVSAAAPQNLDLSSRSLIEILGQNPGLIVELKSQVAAKLQQRGVDIDAKSISDQMLYDQISTNAEIRSGVMSYLQARGYISPADAQSVGSSAVTPEAGPIQTENVSPTVTAGAAPWQAGEGSPFSDTRAHYPTNSVPTQEANTQSPRSSESTSASTDVPKVLREQAPYNLEAMRDLYTQIPETAPTLRRFGSEIFLSHGSLALARGVAQNDVPLDVPLGPDYVLGRGDTLKIDLWGGVTQSLSRAIDRDGRVLLPEAGSILVAGLTLDKAQTIIESALKRQFRDAQVSVTVARLRSVRVYIVGDVQRPGGYDINSLTTAFGALYAAGGPTSAGSLRFVRHTRGDKVIETIDLYQFLVNGVHTGNAHFESGDALLVPPAGPQVVIYGAVRRAAIYELGRSEASLGSLIDDAGGITAAASMSHVTVERIAADHHRETITLPVMQENGSAGASEAAKSFVLRDGDRIFIAPILPYSERVIYLEGHVVRPGRMPFQVGMKLSDALHSYRDILPEPNAHGEIVRLMPPDLHAETIDFDVPDALIGNSNPALQPFDTIRIFGRYELDAPKVTISGEVLRPGTYPLSKGMTAAQLVRMAGGFKRDALTESADLTSYSIDNGNHVAGALAVVRIGTAVNGSDTTADVLLKPGDILTIHQITGWNEIGESVTVDGQVKFPGSYGFRDGERLSSVLRRAGGFRDSAYPEGAVLIRDQVRELEQKSRDDLVRQIETTSASARLSPAIGGSDTGATLQLIKIQQDEVLNQLKSHPPTGRLVIHISTDINSWADTPADIELRRGDVITIPRRPGFILVTGQVYNATALTFTPGKSAGWYLSRAGGTNTAANRKEIFVIRANGSVIGRHSGGWFDADVLSTKLNPGDVVVVPQKIIGSSFLWKNLLTTAQLASSIAITAAVAAL